MSRVCQITGKGPMTGNTVSHANNRTKRRQFPNIQKKRIWLDDEQRWVTLRLSTRAIRSISKLGLKKYARKQGVDLDKLLRR